MLDIDYGDGQTTAVNIHGKNKKSYGIDVPTTLNPADVFNSVPDHYILINTETSENGYFESIELFASTPGPISLSVIQSFNLDLN